MFPPILDYEHLCYYDVESRPYEYYCEGAFLFAGALATRGAAAVGRGFMFAIGFDFGLGVAERFVCG